MDDHTARTRIFLRNSGPTYIVLEDVDTVAATVESGGMATFTSVTGQSAFPPERLVVRCEEIASVQEVCSESWVWQQRVAELHYARQIEDQPPSDRLAAAQERLVAALTDGDDG